MKKSILKILTSGELINHFDQNGDGKVTWKEIRTAPFSVWADIAIKYGLPLLTYFIAK